MTAARNHRPDSGKIHAMKSALVKHRAAKPGLTGVRRVLPQIQTLIEASRQHVISTANLTLVWLYWNVGRVVTVDMQRNQKRADYGQRLIEQLSVRLTRDYGRGFSAPNLWDMKRFFEGFEILQTVSREFINAHNLPSLLAASSDSKICSSVAGKSAKAQILPTVSGESSDRIRIDFAKHFRLGWSHYRILLTLEPGLKRGFYFDQAASQRWATRELQRQIGRALFERVALSRDTKALVRLEKQRGPVETVRYEDAFKDPYLLDFLGLKGAYSEKDLESAILANLQQFLTELGSDFCFVARQFAMRIDDDDYWLDLLFYHRRLRCLVAIDLKIGPFIAADKGQMDLYLSWLKKHDWREGENEPVGLILCTSKKHQHVELLLSHGPHKMQVSEYLTQLPSKRLLADRLKIYSRMLADEDHAS
jgi:predicted nuclease of restriction endonuclease-like (RecB) superfamily